MQELKDFLIDFLIILSAATPKQIKTMKKNYMKPALRVVRIQQKCQILSGSVTSVESGQGFLLTQASLRAERDSPAGNKDEIITKE